MQYLPTLFITFFIPAFHKAHFMNYFPNRNYILICIFTALTISCTNMSKCKSFRFKDKYRHHLAKSLNCTLQKHSRPPFHDKKKVFLFTNLWQLLADLLVIPDISGVKPNRAAWVHLVERHLLWWRTVVRLQCRDTELNPQTRSHNIHSPL